MVSGQERKRPASIQKEDGLDIAVKYVYMGCSEGYGAPILLIIAVPSMEEGDMAWYTTSSLSHSPDPTGVGHLVFCNSRAGNDRLFDKFIKDFVIPTVEGVREHHGAKVSPYYMLFDAIHIVAFVYINISTACRW